MKKSLYLKSQFELKQCKKSRKMKEKVVKILNWIITIATAITVLIDKVFPSVNL